MHSQIYCVSTFKSSYSVFPCAELQINSLEMKLLREREKNNSVGRFVSNSRSNDCSNKQEINITGIFLLNVKHFASLGFSIKCFYTNSFHTVPNTVK